MGIAIADTGITVATITIATTTVIITIARTGGALGSAGGRDRVIKKRSARTEPWRFFYVVSLGVIKAISPPLLQFSFPQLAPQWSSAS